MTGRAKIPLLAGEWTKVLISAVVVIALDPGGKPFLQAVPRQIQQHWWKAFLTRCREAGNWSDPLNFLCQWTGFGQLPVTIRRIYRESWPTVGTPYLCFALTVKKRPFSLE
jgi:hypothetical protein